MMGGPTKNKNSFVQIFKIRPPGRAAGGRIKQADHPFILLVHR